MNKKELNKYIIESIGILILITAYTMISLVTRTPHFISYLSLPVALLVIVAFYYVIRSNSLSIAWNTITKRKNRTPEEINSAVISLDSTSNSMSEIEESFDQLEGIEMSDTEQFDFLDNIADTYDKASAEELAEVASNLTQSKIGRMNLQTHKKGDN